MKKLLVCLLTLFSSIALAVIPPMSEERLLEMSSVVALGFVHRVELEGVKSQKGSETRSYKAQVYVYNKQKGNVAVGKSITVRFVVTRVAPSTAGGAVSCGNTPQATLRLGDQARVYLNLEKSNYVFSHSDGVRLLKNTTRADLPDEAQPIQETPIPSGLK